MNKLYAGIGARNTPIEILNYMKQVSLYLNEHKYILRSGHAIGADRAFESVSKYKDIYTTSDATDRAIQLASKYHFAWDRCNDYVRKLFGRNMQILLGRDLDTPVEFVICWTSNGKDIGGTGHTIRAAWDMGIPVFNMYNQLDDIEKLLTNINLKEKSYE